MATEVKVDRRDGLAVSMNGVADNATREVAPERSYAVSDLATRLPSGEASLLSEALEHATVPSKSFLLQAQASAERARLVRSGEPSRISRDDILIVPKLSALEYDMRRLALSRAELLRRYNSDGVDAERIVASHEVQREGLSQLRELFHPGQFIDRNDVGPEVLARAPLVVAFGGDNHFQFVAQALRENFILGINADPERSDGVILQISIDRVREALDRLVRGEFKIQEWTRLAGRVGDRDLPLALCEYYIGERERLQMSRNLVELHGTREQHKGSGVLLATGTGSTGWLDSEMADYLAGGDIIPRTEPSAIFFSTAPFRGRLSGVSVRHDRLVRGDECTVTSHNDSEGIIGVDALIKVPFPRGARATFYLAPQPLKVVHL